MLDDVDLLVCGAGPVGCVVAERAAAVLGWKVLVVDRRPHIAGNCYDSFHKNGVLIHNYGPHYFRTNSESLRNYLGRFTDWVPANYEVRSFVRSKLLQFPINIATLEQFFGRPLDAGSAERLLHELRTTIAKPAQFRGSGAEPRRPRIVRRLLQELHPQAVGPFVRELEPEVCGRVPVRLNRDPRYVDHRYQVMPRLGFTAMFAKMLEHRKIRVLLDCDFGEVRQLIRPRQATVYSGPIDEYFGCRLGRLPYRSLKFDFVSHNVEYVQPCVQINYPNDFEYTRSVEIKHATRQQHASTVISYETPTANGEPYYPVPRAENRSVRAISRTGRAGNAVSQRPLLRPPRPVPLLQHR